MAMVASDRMLYSPPILATHFQPSLWSPPWGGTANPARVLATPNRWLDTPRPVLDTLERVLDTPTRVLDTSPADSRDPLSAVALVAALGRYGSLCYFSTLEPRVEGCNNL